MLSVVGDWLNNMCIFMIKQYEATKSDAFGDLLNRKMFTITK